jgi:hypothetical protein
MSSGLSNVLMVSIPIHVRPKCDWCERPAFWLAFIKGEPAYACGKRHRDVLRRRADLAGGFHSLPQVVNEV